MNTFVWYTKRLSYQKGEGANDELYKFLIQHITMADTMSSNERLIAESELIFQIQYMPVAFAKKLIELLFRISHAKDASMLDLINNLHHPVDPKSDEPKKEFANALMQIKNSKKIAPLIERAIKTPFYGRRKAIEKTVQVIAVFTDADMLFPDNQAKTIDDALNRLLQVHPIYLSETSRIAINTIMHHLVLHL